MSHSVNWKNERRSRSTHSTPRSTASRSCKKESVASKTQSVSSKTHSVAHKSHSVACSSERVALSTGSSSFPCHRLARMSERRPRSSRGVTSSTERIPLEDHSLGPTTHSVARSCEVRAVSTEGVASRYHRRASRCHRHASRNERVAPGAGCTDDQDGRRAPGTDGMSRESCQHNRCKARRPDRFQRFLFIVARGAAGHARAGGGSGAERPRSPQRAATAAPSSRSLLRSVRAAPPRASGAGGATSLEEERHDLTN
jgi:hypothetical protein